VSRDGVAGARIRVPARSACIPAVLLALTTLGCDSLPSPPGRPPEADRYVPPAEVVDFEPIYAQHCSGCHGADGVLGAARALHDPVYLAIVPREALDRKIRAGVEGTPMPAFARSEGGPLTGDQVAALVGGLKQTWGEVVPGPLPAYAATASGDPDRGRAAFGIFCAKCHGADGRGTAHEGGSVIDSAYLGLVSDQGLRTSVIVGRADLGTPDWRSYVKGRPMTEQEIADVVAWLVSQRPRFPGQPYPEPRRAAASPAALQPSPEGDSR
jgi:cytochrome c oxidase cbb3-type subunit 3